MSAALSESGGKTPDADRRTGALAREGISVSQVMEKMTGGSRTDDQIAREGARLTISQIGKLRRQLDQLERDAQHVVATGRGRKDSAAIWKRVSKAADLLLGAFA